MIYNNCDLPQPQWKWQLGKKTEVTFYVVNAPNKFHRWMQKKLLGIYWERL